MKSLSFNPLHILTFFFIISYNGCGAAPEKQQKNTYIVHMDRANIPTSYTGHSEWYTSSLSTVSEPTNMLYSYNEVVHGYSARLTPDEATWLKSQPGVLSIVEEVVYELHTTRTPLFLGLESGRSLLPDASSVSDVIVGVLDTGVWPESKSYDDTGLGPVPGAWKGECETGTNFTLSSCNRKLIGARFFSNGYESAFGPIDETTESKSPRDDQGHGTHTSSTVAGSRVFNADLYGYAKGTASGIATNARVAMYKVCWRSSCTGSDILAGMDQAVQDGVHVLSASLGNASVSQSYDQDALAVASFAAMAKGVFVSVSVGNAGPDPWSAINVAPWAISVGAGTLDRVFPASVLLGNGQQFVGASLHAGGAASPEPSPIVYGAECNYLTLHPTKVSNAYVLCESGKEDVQSKSIHVRNAGGLAAIIINPEVYGDELNLRADLWPTLVVGYSSGQAIKAYATKSGSKTATLTWGETKVGVGPSPKVAVFSSRGPNFITPAILKPDIIAPGVNILAGWTGRQGPSGMSEDHRQVEFNIVSGTSMACPHVSGVAALIKAANPTWSPAAIRSAIMTTAYHEYGNGAGTLQIDDGSSLRATPYDYGAGHVDPVSALRPGLVYDNLLDDYIDLLCAENYTSEQIKLISKKDYTCQPGKAYNVGDLNYPTFSVPFIDQTTLKYKRTLTLVGDPGTYRVSIFLETKDVEAKVEPEELTFAGLYQKKDYTVTFTAERMPKKTSTLITSSGRLVWSDGKHNVSSSIAFFWSDKKHIGYAKTSSGVSKIATCLISILFWAFVCICSLI